MSIYTKQMPITPAMAKEWLENRARQRPINRASVDDLKRQINEKLWKLTHQGIAISKSNKLLDGQHRLTAIVELGVTLPMMVTYGLEENTFAVMDVGRKRRPSDILGIEGYSRTSILAPAAKIALQLCRGKVQYTLPVAHPELLAFVKANEDLLEHYTTKASRLRYGKPTVAAVCFVFAHVVGTDRADQFLEDVYTGANLGVNNAALRLREKLNNRVKGTNQAAESVLGWTMLAANKYFLNKPICNMVLAKEASLRFVVDPDVGNLPVIAGI